MTTKLSVFLLLAIALPAAAQNYVPLTANERLKWFGLSTYGPTSLLIGGPISAGFQTLGNQPDEWGPHWEGFGRRYAARIPNNTVTNGIEVSAGAVWKEDPRYFRLGQGSAGRRMGQVLKMIVMSRYGDGSYRPGAAKAIGITGGSFAQKLWMPDSVTSNRDCAIRIGTGYLGRFFGNFFQEFGPDITRKLRKK